MINSWIPLIAVLATAIVGGIVYRFQKGVDRKETLKKERRVLYQSFLETVRRAEGFALNMQWPEQHQHYETWKTCEAILLVSAPTEVALRLRPLRMKYLSFLHQSQSQGYSEELYDAYATELYRVIFDMRKDILEKSKLNAEFNPNSFVEEMDDANLPFKS